MLQRASQPHVARQMDRRAIIPGSPVWVEIYCREAIDDFRKKCEFANPRYD
jgi:hypothetical protein